MSTEPQSREHVPSSTPDPNEYRTAALRDLFPEAFTEGKLDLDKFKDAAGLPTVEGPADRYSFSWAGKRDAIRLLQTPSSATLTPAPDESVDWDTTRNLFIEGDNLEVLKLLYKSYFGQVKMIYIDPPYNTGNDYVYPDNYSDPLDAYLELTGQKDSEGNRLSSNSDTSGRYHSSWLSMIYPRLSYARQLLCDNGVIFVSIDDHEIYNLRHVMNEVFGEENFVAQIAWQSRQSIQNDTDISVNHEYIVAYAKVRRQVERRLKESNASSWYEAQSYAAYPLPLDPTRFSNPDSDPRGPWKADPFDAPNVRPNLTYAIRNPKTLEEHWPPNGRCWRTEEKNYLAYLADNRIVFGRSGDARPQLKVFYEEKKDFGQVANTWFDGATHGTATHGTSVLQDLFDGVAVFNSPKPPSLIKSLALISTKPGDIVLDFFAGSGSTAHAVLELNQDSETARRFILIQLPEPTPTDSAARQAGYETIAEVGKERIRRVIIKMKREQTGKLDPHDKSTPDDLGFRVFKLAPSDFLIWRPPVQADPDDYATQMALFTGGLDDEWKPENVIWEVALREGFSLSSEITSFDHTRIPQNTIYRVDDPDKGQHFFICLDDSLDLASVAALHLNADQLFICRDTAIDDTAAANLALQCRLITL